MVIIRLAMPSRNRTLARSSGIDRPDLLLYNEGSSLWLANRFSGSELIPTRDGMDADVNFIVLLTICLAKENIYNRMFID